MMPSRKDTPARDPAARKTRDLARQRKIASNNSDKAARRHARTIKAMENRKIRRQDKQSLLPDLEESADQIALQHRVKSRHWGTENAAERRAASKQRQRRYQKAGGRVAAQIEDWQAVRDRTDSAEITRLLNQTLARLCARKKSKDQS